MGPALKPANLRQRIAERTLAYPSSHVALIVTMGFLVLCAFLQLVAPNTPLEHHWSHTPTATLTVLCMLPATVIWGASAYFRSSDANLRRRIYQITLLCVFWYLITLLKYATEYDNLSALLWYLYYTPMIFIPTLMLFCALDTANLRRVGRNGSHPLLCLKHLKRAIALISGALSILILTNSLHQLAFRSEFSLFPPGLKYTYGPVYFVAFAWIALLAVTFLVILFINARKQLRSILLFMAGFVGLLGAYAALYVLRVDIALKAPVTVVMILGYTLTLDLCLRCGLLPSCANFALIFKQLPLDLKLNAQDGRQTIATDAATPTPENLFGQARRALQRQSEPAAFQPPGQPNKRCQAYKVSGGLAVATKNLTAVNARKRALENRRAVLEKQNGLLEQYRRAQTQMLRRHDENELFKRVEGQLADAVEAIALILDGLEPQTLDSAPAQLAERRRQLMLVKLLVSYCKRKGGLTLIEQDHADFARDRLTLIINETLTDLRPAGVDCAALIEVDETLPATSTSVCCDSLYAFAITAVELLRGRDWTESAAGEEAEEPSSEAKASTAADQANAEDPTLMLSLRNVDQDATELRIALEASRPIESRSFLPLSKLESSLDQQGLPYTLERKDQSLLLNVRIPRRS